MRGFREFRASLNAQTFQIPAGVSSILIELWGGGGGGAQGSNLEGGAGGGGGGYARTVVSVEPGQTWFVTVGLGGNGVPGNGGEPGQPSFINSPAGFVARASGGLGGSGLTPGLGGGCSIAGLAMAVCRNGAPGSAPSSGVGGSGGRAVFGSIEPIGSVGGRGGNASTTPVPGAPGTDGYVFISW